MKNYTGYTAKIYDTLGNDEVLLLSNFEKTGYLDIMSTPSGGSTSITPRDNKSSVSSIKFEVINKDEIISKFIYRRLNTDNVMLYEEMVDIHGVLNGVETLIYRGLIRSITNDTFETKYTIEISDFQDRLKASIFDRELSEYLAETLAQINTYRLPYYISGSTRKGFTVIERTVDGETKKIITFDGHVIDFVEMFFKMIFSNEVIQVGMPYLTNRWQDFVDTNSLQEVRDALTGALYNFYLEFTDPVSNPYEYLTENIYKVCSIFPYVNLEGKLGLKLHKQPSIDVGIDTLSEDNIIQVKSKNITTDTVINNMLIRYDKNFTEDKYMTKKLKVSERSFNKYKILIPDSPEEYKVDGINNLSDTDKSTFATSLSDNMFSRYGIPSVELELVIPLSVGYKYKVGDYLFVSHKSLIEWEGTRQGLRGLVGDETDVESDTVVNLNVGDQWGAFVSGNNLGVSINGYTVIDTTSVEIRNDIFNGSGKSCKNNHTLINNLLVSEGV